MNRSISPSNVSLISSNVNSRHDTNYIVVVVDDYEMSQAEASKQAENAREIRVLPEWIGWKVEIRCEVEFARLVVLIDFALIDAEIARVENLKVIGFETDFAAHEAFVLEQSDELMAQDKAS